MFPVPLNNLNDQQRHDFILKTYVLNKAKNTDSKRYKRDIDVIKEHHRFLWHDEDEDANATTSTWEERLARRYYDKLFKEYCIADLSHYKDNKIALRWRVESEVVNGKGQFQCGCRSCEAREGLRTWEVNFGYLEQGTKKNALVKVRLCPEHSAQLNYNSQKREVKRMKKQHAKERRARKKNSKYGITKTNEQSKTGTQTNEEEKLDDVNSTATRTTTTEEIENESEIMECHKNNVQDMDMGDNVWNKKLEVENQQEKREQEFEKYLEDLLF